MNENELTEKLFKNVKKSGKEAKVGTNSKAGGTMFFNRDFRLGPNSNIHTNNHNADWIKDIEEITKDNPQPSTDTKNYEMVDHPSHYNSYDIEVIDMMERIWGIDATILFCIMNAFKYRQRIGLKPGQDILQDLGKEKWYLNKAKELKKKK